jgi:endo-1,4-beta-mannosidase
MKGASVLFALDNAARDCDAAVAMGLNTIRIVNFLDEGSAGSPYDAWRWSRVDGLISAAKTRGLRVILDLSTYRNQLHNQGKNPYTTDWGPFLTFVAGKYKAETAIALYALAGEPEPNDASYLVAFYQKALSQLRMADPNHIITAGGLLQYSWGGVPWQQIFDVTDLGTVHVYSAGDEGYLPTIASYCAGKGKPWIIEEFGFEQSMGDSSRATSFSRVYGEAKSASGVAFWNLGPEVKPDTYDVNAQTPLTLAAVQAN